jgi:hypothetical protein
MSCHYGGIIAKADEIRKNVEANRINFRTSAEKILALYPPKEEIDKLYEENAARFRRAVNEVGIQRITQEGEPIVNMALRFENDVDARNAAAELGLKVEDFLKALKLNAAVQGRLGPLNVEGGTVKRDLFAKEFAPVVAELGLGEPLKPAAKPAEPAVAKTDEKPAEKPAEANKPAAAPQKATTLRIWTDVKTSATIEAEYVNLVGDKVELRATDGSTLQFPLVRLSQADRKFVQDQLQKALEGPLSPAENSFADVPPAPGPAAPPPGPAAPPPGPYPASLSPPALEYRLWKNVAIRKTIRAAFVSLVRGDLKLQEERFKGAITTWPMEHLAPEDQEYVKQVVGVDHYEAHKELPANARSQY